MQISSISSIAYNQRLRQSTNNKNKDFNKIKKNEAVSFKSSVNYDKGVYIILDGFGVGTDGAPANPFNEAKMPFYNSLLQNKNGDILYRQIGASGNYVGLPVGFVGNSEAGHDALGSGRVIPQDWGIIDDSIKDGSFFKNEVFLNAINHVKENGSTLHIMGLLSPGYVHSDIQQMYRLIDMAKANDVKDVRVHAFLDGRDVPEGTGVKYIQETNEYLTEKGYKPIASIMGMKYPMDRAGNWDATESAYNLLVKGKARIETGNNMVDAVNKLYELYNDKDIPPCKTDYFKSISDNDSVIFANYRPDRARQITNAITQADTAHCSLPNLKKINNLDFVCMSQYDSHYNLPVAFLPESYEDTLTETLDDAKINPTLITETEKKAHLTFFFDGKRFMDFPNTEKIIFPSQKPVNFTPEMRAEYITNAINKKIRDDKTNAIIVNYSNADMIGHTGDYEQGVKTLEVIDSQLKKVVTRARKYGVPVIITADHGNIENMYKNAAHTNNPVPFIMVLPGKENDIKQGRIRLSGEDLGISSFAPTILDINDIPKPNKMTGSSIIEDTPVFVVKG